MNMRQLMLILLFVSHAGYAQHYKAGRAISMEEAIKTALSNNPEIKTAQERINAASGRLWSGISLPMPELSLSYEYVPKGEPLSRFGEKTFGITQQIEFPSNYFLRGFKYSYEKETAETELKQKELSVVSRVKTAYMNTLARQQELKLAEENLAIAEDFLQKADIRMNAGEAAYLEQLTAKVQFTEAKNSLNVSKNALSSAIAGLNFAMGFGREDSDENFILTDSLAFAEENLTLETLLQSAAENNPAIRLYEQRLKAASVDKTLAWTGFLPSFSVSYYTQSMGGSDDLYGASFGVSLPLWFMFDQKGRIQEAEAGRQTAHYELKGVKNEYYLIIKNAFAALQNAVQQVRLYRSAILPQSEEVYRTAERSYEAGEITYLEFLQAKQIIISSKNNFINALLAYNIGVIALEEAIGKRLK